MSPRVSPALALALLAGLSFGTAPSRRNEDAEALPPWMRPTLPPFGGPLGLSRPGEALPMERIATCPANPREELLVEVRSRRVIARRALPGEPFVEPSSVEAHKGRRKASRAQRKAAQ